MKRVKKLMARVLRITPILFSLGGLIIAFAENVTTRCMYPAWVGAPEMPAVLQKKIK